MEEIKPKKERKFLKAVGKVAGILIQEFVLGLGRKFIGKKIDRIGNKRQALLIFLALFCNIAFASIDSIPYPITGNKQRLGWQTTGNGLVYRGRASDTITKPSNYTNKDIKAYLLVDTVNNVLYNYIASKGGWKFNNSDTVIIQGATMPFDSITFNTAKDGTVGVGEVEYNDTQGSLIQGLKGGNVTNVIGQQLHQRVSNKTGSTLAKGTVVYLSGSQGNRITVAKALATSDPTSANTFGIVAEEILDNQSGYVITEGLITNINTSALTQDSAVYLSGTTAGALTSTKPQAPIHGVYIGVCVKSNAGSGELFVKIRNGQELDELHDVQITSPVDKASLYYKSSEELWRDTTAALLVSDTATMLTNYLRTGTASLTYQPILISGTNIKTVNSNSLLGSGNVSVGTVTSVSGSGAISSTGGNTPVISVADAAFGTAGIVTASGTQQFSGDKFFEGITTFNARAVFKDYTYTATRLAGLSSTDRFATVTLGTGLSLSSGTLSATSTGTVTNVTGTAPISVANGTTTPSITIADASASVSGVVNTTTQSFAGNKTFTGTLDVGSTGTFGGRVKTNWLERNYAYSTSSSFTVSVNTTWQDINTAVLTTITLPNAATYPGKEIHIRQTGAGSIQSASSNIIPFLTAPTGSTTTSILLASTHRAVTLVSDGTNWIIMQRSQI